MIKTESQFFNSFELLQNWLMLATVTNVRIYPCGEMLFVTYEFEADQK